jgi:hypothetical protein
LETEPPAVNFGKPVHSPLTVRTWAWATFASTATTRGSMRPAWRSVLPSASRITFGLLSSASVSGLG